MIQKGYEELRKRLSNKALYGPKANCFYLLVSRLFRWVTRKDGNPFANNANSVDLSTSLMPGKWAQVGSLFTASVAAKS